MSDENLTGESTEWIIGQAKQKGIDVSERQLSEWHRKGVISSPKHRGLGRGRGSISLYPHETLKQVLVFEQLLRKYRSVEKAAFWLWAENYPVKSLFWQPVFEKRHKIFLSMIVQSSDQDEHEIIENEELNSPLDFNFIQRQGIFRRAKQRLGKLNELINFLISITKGHFEISHHEEDNEHDENIIMRALGFIEASHKRQIPELFFISDFRSEIMNIFVLISREFLKLSNADYVSRKQEDFLRNSFKEIIVLKDIAIDLAHQNLSEAAKTHPFFKVIEAICTSRNIESLVDFALVWSTIKDVPEFQENLAKLMALQQNK